MLNQNKVLGCKSKGFSLIEIILSISLSMLLLVSVFSIYKKVSGYYKTKETAEQILTINRNIKNIFRHSDYSDLDSFIKTAKEKQKSALQIFPDAMIKGVGGRYDFYNGFGRPVQLSEGAYSNEFYIYTSVPVEYCTNLSSLIFSQSHKISMNGNEFENYSIESPSRKNNIDVSNLSRTCHSDSNPYVYITFYFY